MNAKPEKKTKKLKAKECPLSLIKIIKNQIKPHLESQISLCGHKMLHLLGNNVNLALIFPLHFLTFICGTQIIAADYFLQFYKEVTQIQIYISDRSTGLAK